MNSYSKIIFIEPLVRIHWAVTAYCVKYGFSLAVHCVLKAALNYGHDTIILVSAG